MKRKAVIMHILAGCALALFLLVLLECGLRIFVPAGEPQCRTVFGPAPGPGSRPAVVLLAGDCLADEKTASGPYGPAAALRASLAGANPQIPVTVVNAAVCGQNSRQTLAGMRALLGRHAPDFVVVLSGDSDRWNISGPGRDCADFICSTASVRLPSCPLPPSGWFKNTGLAKVYGRFWLKLHNKYLFWQSGAADPARLAAAYAQGGMDEEMVLSYADAMRRQRRTDKVYSLALAMIAAVKPGSAYFAEDLSFYRLFARAAWTQGREAAAAEDLRALLKSRPELAGNGVFRKYVASLSGGARFTALADEGLKSNLEEIIALVRHSGAVVLLQNYPAGNRANSLINEVAIKIKAPLVDHAAAFARLAGRNDSSRLLEQDGLCLSSGCGVIAGDIADVADGMLSRDRAILLE